MTPEEERKLRERFAEAIVSMPTYKRTEAWDCFNTLTSTIHDLQDSGGDREYKTVEV